MAEMRIDRFKAQLLGGGARSNLFQVEMNWIGSSGLTELGTFLIKAAQLPASIVTPIMVPFRGRQLQVAGDKTFEPWNVTVINDRDMRLRNAFETWSNTITQNEENIGLDNPASYQSNAQVYQLDKAGKKVKGYDFRGIWPSNVSSIDLSFDSENTIEEFTVEFQVQYWNATGVVGQDTSNITGVEI